MPPEPLLPADHDDAVILLGDIRAVNAPSSRVHVYRDAQRQAAGAAIWKETAAGPDGLAIALAPGQDLDTLLRLAQLCISDALARGHETGTFVIHNAALLRTLQRSFTLRAEPIGWQPATKDEEPFTTPVSWRVTGDLAQLHDELMRHFG